MKPQHIAICNELRKLIRSGRITKIVVTSLDGKEVAVYRLNQGVDTFYEQFIRKGEKK